MGIWDLCIQSVNPEESRIIIMDTFTSEELINLLNMNRSLSVNIGNFNLAITPRLDEISHEIVISIPGKIGVGLACNVWKICSYVNRDGGRDYSVVLTSGIFACTPSLTSVYCATEIVVALIILDKQIQFLLDNKTTILTFYGEDSV